MANGPLSGIRILDMSRVLAGPWASQLLADYGADVIKVELPGEGDATRQWGPPWLEAKSVENDRGDVRDAAYFLAANRNKRSLTCDFTQPDGAAILRRLAAKSDVVLENFRAGVLDRYDLGADALQALNPRLVFCSVTAYGRSGSRAQEPGYDAMIQASAGLMSITGEPEEKGGGPQKVGVAIADLLAGLYAASAVVAALHARNETGRGDRIDVPLFDCQVAALANQAMNHLVGGVVPGRLGTAHPNIVPYQAFDCSDGQIMVAVGTNRQFRACMAALDLVGVAEDPRFTTNAARVEHRDALVAAMAERFSKASAGSWLSRLQQQGVPAGPVNDLGAVFREPYVAEADLVRQVEHSAAGAIPTVTCPVRFGSCNKRVDLAPPLLGEHTDEILREELGFAGAEIERLRRSGAI